MVDRHPCFGCAGDRISAGVFFSHVFFPESTVGKLVPSSNVHEPELTKSIRCKSMSSGNAEPYDVRDENESHNEGKMNAYTAPGGEKVRHP